MNELVIIGSLLGAVFCFALIKGKGLRELHEDTAGAHLIEYALVAVLIAIVVIAVLRALGGTIRDTFQEIDDQMNAPPT